MFGQVLKTGSVLHPYAQRTAWQHVKTQLRPTVA